MPTNFNRPDSAGFFMLHHVEDPSSFFKSIRRKWPAAVLIIAQYGPTNRDPVSSRPPRTLTMWDSRSLEVALARAGYRATIQEFESSGSEHRALLQLEHLVKQYNLPGWLYRAAKQIEKVLVANFFLPFRKESFALLAIANPSK